MRKYSAFNALLVVYGLVFSAVAGGQTPVMQWDRSSAMAAAQTIDIDAEVYEIGKLSSLADGAKTLARLKHIETRGDWPLPAREAVVYEFTRSLAGDAVATEVMRHLSNFRARVLVPHDDHGKASIPLFNVRGVAAGVENGWQRAEFTLEAATLLESSPETLATAYLQSTNHNRRSGYLDALRQAEMADVLAIQHAALEQLGEAPGLTPVVAVTAVISADIFAIQQLLTDGRGAGLSSALKQLDQQLQISDTAALLNFAIQQAPASNAALAMAAWWPRLRHDPASRDLMVDLLADPELGTSAALALAQSPDIQTIKVLQDTARGDSSAARRAQMALDINRSELIGELQP